MKACIVLPQNPAVIKFQFPRVSPGDQLLAKGPEDSGYEIELTDKLLYTNFAVDCILEQLMFSVQ